jgi:hypothetical protein
MKKRGGERGDGRRLAACSIKGRRRCRREVVKGREEELVDITMAYSRRLARRRLSRFYCGKLAEFGGRADRGACCGGAAAAHKRRHRGK